MKIQNIKLNKQKGAGILLVLGVILVVVIVSAIILRLAISRRAPQPEENGNGEPYFEAQYEVVVGNIKFTLKEAINKGSTLKVSEIESTQHYGKKDLVTTEKFIKVTIGAENIGKEKIERGWEIKEIIDEEERVFESMREYDVRDWLPADNNCLATLYPGFSPVYCTQIYEVARVSTKLKIKVASTERNNEGEDFIDLFVIPEGDI